MLWNFICPLKSCPVSSKCLYVAVKSGNKTPFSRSELLPKQKNHCPELSSYRWPCHGLVISERNKVAVEPPLTQSGKSVVDVGLGSKTASNKFSVIEYSAIELSCNLTVYISGLEYEGAPMIVAKCGGDCVWTNTLNPKGWSKHCSSFIKMIDKSTQNVHH